MARGLGDKLAEIQGRFSRLSARERRMLGGLLVTLVLGGGLVVAYLVSSSLDEIEEENAAIRAALKDLQTNRACYVEHKADIARIESRIAGPPLELTRLVETTASAVGVSISESTDQNPQNIDRFVQRAVSIRLEKVTVAQIARLMKELESSPRLVQVIELEVSAPYWKQTKELEVTLVVATYERRTGEADSEGSKRRRTKPG